MTYPIPKEAFDDRLAIVGTAGSGKTYLTLGAIEHLLARKSRIIGIDPLGVMWGLRLCSDGKTPSPFQPVIFGGAHGDLPINEHAGGLIGEAIATSRESCIIDLSQLGTKAAERRFMLALLSALYRATNKEPVHLIIDEADMFAPQKLLDKDGDAARLLGMMETIVRRGRVKGFIPWLITQRPQVLSKDILSQADGLVALKLTSSQDRGAIRAWVESTADQGQWKMIDAKLPTYQRGDGVVWIPARGILREVTFPEKATYDSSRTPKRGEKRHAAELQKLDIGALKDRLATVEAEAKANDPRALKNEIAQLRKDLSNAHKTESPVTKEAVAALEKNAEVLGYAHGYRAGSDDAFAKVWELSDLAQSFAHSVADKLRSAKAMRELPQEVKITKRIPSSSNGRTPAFEVGNRGSTPREGTNGRDKLPPGELAVLIAAAQFDGVDRDQLSVLTGYKRSSRDAYIQRLREKGYVQTDGQTIRVTTDGEHALPDDYEPLPTGRYLQDYWLQRLPSGEKAILQQLIRAYPNGVQRGALDEATGYKRSSRDAYIQRMKARRLVVINGSEVLATERLFA